MKSYQTRLILSLASILIIVLVNSLRQTNAESNNLTIVYQIKSPNKSHIKWHRIVQSTEEQSITVNALVLATALPSKGNYLAYATRDGSIYVVNLPSAETVLLDVKLDTQTYFPYDEVLDRSRSLRWSPDGQNLAFVGQTSAGKQYLYVYQPLQHKLNELLAAPEGKVIAAPMWSPNQEHLALLIRWDQDQYTFEPLIVSYDAPFNFSRIAPDQSSCRLYWSPNSQSLVTTFGCYLTPTNRPATSNLPGLSIFDSRAQKPVINLPAVEPERSVWQYERPYWKSPQELVSLRKVNRLDEQVPSSAELMNYSLITNQLTPISELAAATQQFRSANYLSGDWMLWSSGRLPSKKFAFEAVEDRLINLSGLYECVTNISISDDGNYLALPSDCNPDSASAFHIYSLTMKQDIFQLLAQPSQQLMPLGFIEVDYTSK